MVVGFYYLTNYYDMKEKIEKSDFNDLFSAYMFTLTIWIPGWYVPNRDILAMDLIAENLRIIRTELVKRKEFDPDNLVSVENDHIDLLINAHVPKREKERIKRVVRENLLIEILK